MTRMTFVLGAMTALALLASGCGSQGGAETYGSHQQAVSDPPATWMNGVGVDTTTPGNLTKTGTVGWNAGAASNETFTGDGYVEFTTGEANTYKLAGLSSGDTDVSTGDIDYAIYLQANGHVSIYENNVSRGSFGTYVAGDVFRVASTGGVVTYSKNGSTLYTSTVAPAATLGIDTSLYTVGATIQNALVHQSTTATFWANEIGVASGGTLTITKTDSHNLWNAGASSGTSFSGDGYAEFTTNETNTYKIAGLSSDDADVTPADIDFGIYLQANARISVYENGVNKGYYGGTYAAGDVFRVDSTGGVVTYYKNAALIYTSTATPAATLLLDSSIYSTGGTIANATITGAAPPAFWQNVAQVTVNGNSETKNAVTGWNGGASSTTSFTGDGYVEFTTAETNTYKIAGLSSDDADLTPGDIDFGVYLQGNGRISIYEGGVNKGYHGGSYAAGDVFRVSSNSGVVTYYKNGGSIYVSSTTPASTLLLDSSLYSPGATVNGVVVHAGP